jgi:hypothetical protein
LINVDASVLHWLDAIGDLENLAGGCRQLSKEFPDGPTAQHLRELENELRDQLRAIEKRE